VPGRREILNGMDETGAADRAAEVLQPGGSPEPITQAPPRQISIMGVSSISLDHAGRWPC